MYTLSILCSFLSVICLYASAKRVEIEKRGLLLWLSSHQMASRMVAAALFVASILIFMIHIGLVISILTGLCLWMLLASLMTLFAPFHKVSKIHLAILLILSLGIELSFFQF